MAVTPDRPAAATAVAGPNGFDHSVSVHLRSVVAASYTALAALLLSDLLVLWRGKWIFVLRTIIQPFLL
ncbi:MAG: hypothetical protein M0010_12025 [Actinomycetota bacterium]|nr:hypothetical protein [Actinomycetota bacterium]